MVVSDKRNRDRLIKDLEGMVQALGLHKRVSTANGELEILKGIDLEIKASESVALVGPSGSGKTTLLSLLAGLDTATSGRIYFKVISIHARIKRESYIS